MTDFITPEVRRGTRVRLLKGMLADEVGEVVYRSDERPRCNPYEEAMFVVRVAPGFLTTLLRRDDLEPVSD